MALTIGLIGCIWILGWITAVLVMAREFPFEEEDRDPLLTGAAVVFIGLIWPFALYVSLRRG